jgi:hypothetical protein
MIENKRVILEKLLDRLYASLVQGPCLNCRPHSSRQRIDLTTLKMLKHLSPSEITPKLLTGTKKVEVLAKAPEFLSALAPEQLSEEQRKQKTAFEQQSRLLERLRTLAEDASDYEQATGENALYIGYPLISVSPGSAVLEQSSSRILAPIALIALELTVKRGATQSVTLAVKGAGADLLVANFPLLAWLEQQTGRDTNDLFTDNEGTQPFKEINEIARLLAESLQVPPPPEIQAETILEPVPTTDKLAPGISFLNAAVVGLFPVSNQGLLRDMRSLIQTSELTGPVMQFLSAQANQDPNLAAKYDAPPKRQRIVSEEKLICPADPCQAHATRLAKESPVLVIHGPPGTGKSQTITNIIGDHLSRGERVLMVCDKRTALDVVYNRMTHLGIGDLCAIVHDPQRDQRPLYMKMRDYLDTLVERRTNPTAEQQLAVVDGELQKLHLELSGYFTALSEPPRPDQPTFHDLVGEWLGLEKTNGTGLTIEEAHLDKVTLGDLEPAKAAIAETLDRGIKTDYPKNPWANAAGSDLGEFLTRPIAEIRTTLEKLAPLATTLDQTAGDELPPLQDSDLQEQASTRRRLAELLLKLDGQATPEIRKTWFAKPSEVLKQTLISLQALEAHTNAIASVPLDSELALTIAPKPVAITEITSFQTTLQDYNGTADTWHAFVHLKKKAAAEEVAKKFGLHISADTGKRLFGFLGGLKSRLLCQNFLLSNKLCEATGLAKDADLLEAIAKFKAALEILLEIQQKASSSLATLLSSTLGDPLAGIADKLIKSAERARHLHEFLAAMATTFLFSGTWLSETAEGWRGGKVALPLVQELIEKLSTLETILRMRLAYQQIPEALRNPVAALIFQNADSEAGLKALKRALLTKEISARIRSNLFLQQVDQDRMEKCFERYRELETQKFGLVRDTILARWVGLQKSRLLASTGTQLNSLGASLKRRLVTRGERAMKLRQVILQGVNGSEQDPLFDICPVWMASPATVAQIFPRLSLFDVIVFDEASQCRLEEALPVLLRGKRVVIAGDPKQLPPTRFFETALVESEVVEAESEQDIFEQQQSETEDLLGAALNTAVQQSYLDVHYRSTDEALIGFSNQNFYQNRLQPIPCRPGRRKSVALELIRADGAYEERGNAKEAEVVCNIVEKLLAASTPPSIGIACFNLAQRDVILDALQDRCENNPEFQGRLEQARKRKGSGSFEGLFVKNLENAQGDERDHIIISTTFGPDKNAKFRRNFGPLSQVGGGRRLNVLVTRAREMVHVVTSIPTSEYRSLAPVEDGATPNGRWLLYAYLAYIEALERKKAEGQSRQEAAQSAPVVTIDQTEYASLLAISLANGLADSHRLSSRVPWGTPGFCIDIFVQHPENPDEGSIGVLCDMSRFRQAADPVEWEVFRTSALERQGWNLYRVWSPSIFANSSLHLARIAESSNRNGKPVNAAEER